MTLFEKAQDYAALEQVFDETFRRTAIRILAYCVMPAWPIPCPDDWVAIVQAPQTEAEVAAVRRSVAHGRPFGDDDWVRRTAKCLGLEATLRAQGRPRKTATE
jgi:hypothetical protein